MSPTPCDRCGKQEYIPTHQLFTYQGRQYYLCSQCWNEFRRLYLRPEDA